MARIVLAHGFTQTGANWRPVAERLAAAGHDVAAPDLPGHGAAAADDPELWSGARALGRDHGRAVYVGYSMGGRYCLHLALAAPESVERLVLVGATAGIDDDDARQARRAADDRLAATVENIGVERFLDQWLDNPLFATLPADAAGLDARRANSAAGLARSLRAAGTGAQEPLWDRLHQLRMPVLLVTGEHDPKFTGLAARMAAAIGARARHVVVTGAGHAVHLEQPDAFCAVVLRFLAST